MRNITNFINESASTVDNKSLWIKDSTPDEVTNYISLSDYGDSFIQKRKNKIKLNVLKLERKIWDLLTQLHNLHEDFISNEYDLQGELKYSETDEEKKEVIKQYQETLIQIAKDEADIKKQLTDAQDKLADAKSKLDD